MPYRANSLWNDKTELMAFLIFKKLKSDNSPYGKCAEYCRKMAKETGLKVGSISAKVSNYKSVAGINNKSNASKNTRLLFSEYNHLTAKELSRMIDGM